MLIVAGLATFRWVMAGLFGFALLLAKPAARRILPLHCAAAETEAERRHLLRRIGEPVGEIYHTDPLTLDELARLFRAVR